MILATPLLLALAGSFLLGLLVPLVDEALERGYTHWLLPRLVRGMSIARWQRLLRGSNRSTNGSSTRAHLGDVAWTEATERPPGVEQDQVMIEGTVSWFNAHKGYGFITGEEGKDIFVHFSGVRAGGPRSLNEGDKVEFSIETDEHGPRAVDVVVTQAAPKQGMA